MISATINSDEYFEVLLLNTFKLLHVTPRKNVYAGGAGGRKNYNPLNGYLHDHHRYI